MYGKKNTHIINSVLFAPVACLVKCMLSKDGKQKEQCTFSGLVLSTPGETW
jgi:hypothetical protein